MQKNEMNHSIQESVSEDRQSQRVMHKDYFDRCQDALDHGFYLEAILMEYASIEARLEVILGMTGLPCNKFLKDDDRRKVNISHRISCLEKIQRTSDVFSKSNLPPRYFKKLEKWIVERNGYIHGLYKNEVKYGARMKDAKKVAEKGYILSRLLYNEASRIRRIYKRENAFMRSEVRCSSTGCFLCKKDSHNKEGAQ